MVKGLKKFVKSILENLLSLMGYRIVSKNSSSRSNERADLTADELIILQKVEDFTMTSKERIIALINSVDYIHKRGIEGSFVECGVWRGGSAMAMAFRLMNHKTQDRDIYLYDTFEGMTEPLDVDVSHVGKHARTYMNEIDDWCCASQEDVESNLYGTGYQKAKLHFIKGDVLQTIPTIIPEKIALLRLDTDWYESTFHEMRHLFPRLQKGGILIIDDYGHWSGARKAITEYFEELEEIPFLHRIDYTGRLYVKE